MRFEHLPPVSIEVISISQNIHDLLQKSRKLVASRIRAVWIVEPHGRTVFVITASGTEIFHNTPVESKGIVVYFRKIFGVNGFALDSFPLKSHYRNLKLNVVS